MNNTDRCVLWIKDVSVRIYPALVVKNEAFEKCIFEFLIGMSVFKRSYFCISINAEEMNDLA